MMTKAQAYSEPCQTTKMDLMANIVNGGKLEAAHYIDKLDTTGS